LGMEKSSSTETVDGWISAVDLCVTLEDSIDVLGTASQSIPLSLDQVQFE